MDNKTTTSGNDRQKLSARQDWEMANLRDKFNVNNQQLTDAMKAVGNDRKKIEAFLTGKAIK